MKDRWTVEAHMRGDWHERLSESEEVLFWSDDGRKKNWESLTKDEQLEWVEHIREHAMRSMNTHGTRGDEALRAEMTFHQWMDGLPHDQALEVV